MVETDEMQSMLAKKVSGWLQITAQMKRITILWNPKVTFATYKTFNQILGP